MIRKIQCRDPLTIGALPQRVKLRLLSDAASIVFGLKDDFVGSKNKRIGDWNDGLEEWKTDPRLIEEPSFSESPYNHKLDVGEGGEGNYSLYFNVNVRKVTEEPV